MNFQLKFDVPEAVLECSHNDRFVFLGSCFAEEMSTRVQQAGFHALSNPLGVLFHPLPLAESLRNSIRSSQKVRTCQRDDLWLSWEASSECHAFSEVDLNALILTKRTELREALHQASVLVLTFGTAWAYRLKESGALVANCHKFPQPHFQKELTEIGEMVEVWESVLAEIQAEFPQLHIVLTVSPVRHVKDGLVENNRSKARLIELVHALAQHEKVHYFPAYEIVLDELRDYRFYSEDLVHPSDAALKYVWNAFSRYCLTQDALQLAKEAEDFHSAFRHASLHPDSAADRQRRAQLEERFKAFRSAHPDLHFPTE